MNMKLLSFYILWAGLLLTPLFASGNIAFDFNDNDGTVDNNDFSAYSVTVADLVQTTTSKSALGFINGRSQFLSQNAGYSHSFTVTIPASVSLNFTQLSFTVGEINNDPATNSWQVTISEGSATPSTGTTSGGAGTTSEDVTVNLNNLNDQKGKSLTFTITENNGGNNNGTTQGTFIDNIVLEASIAGISLTNVSIPSNDPIGTFVGNISYNLSGNNTTYSLGTGGDNLLFEVLGTGNAIIGELRNNAFLASGNSYSITISANNNSGNVDTQDYLILASASTGPSHTASVDVRHGPSDGSLVATMESSSGLLTTTYSLESGRTDLFTIDGNSLKVANASSWGGIGTEYYVKLGVTDSLSQTSYLTVKVSVSKRPRGTIILIN